MQRLRGLWVYYKAELGAYKRCRRELSRVRGFGKNRGQPRKRERVPAWDSSAPGGSPSSSRSPPKPPRNPAAPAELATPRSYPDFRRCPQHEARGALALSLRTGAAPAAGSPGKCGAQRGAAGSPSPGRTWKGKGAGSPPSSRAPRDPGHRRQQHCAPARGCCAQLRARSWRIQPARERGCRLVRPVELDPDIQSCKNGSPSFGTAASQTPPPVIPATPAVDAATTTATTTTTTSIPRPACPPNSNQIPPSPGSPGSAGLDKFGHPEPSTGLLGGRAKVGPRLHCTPLRAFPFGEPRAGPSWQLGVPGNLAQNLRPAGTSTSGLLQRSPKGRVRAHPRVPAGLSAPVLQADPGTALSLLLRLLLPLPRPVFVLEPRGGKEGGSLGPPSGVWGWGGGKEGPTWSQSEAGWRWGGGRGLGDHFLQSPLGTPEGLGPCDRGSGPTKSISRGPQTGPGHLPPAWEGPPPAASPPSPNGGRFVLGPWNLFFPWSRPCLPLGGSEPCASLVGWLSVGLAVSRSARVLSFPHTPGSPRMSRGALCPPPVRKRLPLTTTSGPRLPRHPPPNNPGGLARHVGGEWSRQAAWAPGSPHPHGGAIWTS